MLLEPPAATVGKALHRWQQHFSQPLTVLHVLNSFLLRIEKVRVSQKMVLYSAMMTCMTIQTRLDQTSAYIALQSMHNQISLCVCPGKLQVMKWVHMSVILDVAGKAVQTTH